MSQKVIGLLLAALLAAWSPPAGAGEYDLSIPEAEKKPYDLGGRVEFRYVHHRLDSGSAPYGLAFHRYDPGAYVEEWRPLIEFAGSYSQGVLQMHFRTHHEYTKTYQGGQWLNRVYDGYLSLKPSANLTIEAGKKTFLWGKGYAWNPVGFVSRAKDPDDPNLSLEGYTVFSVDYIKSFAGGSLKNLALTALVLPVLDGWENTELGQSGDVNYAVKLYLLWHDTDLDFIYFGGPNQPESYGFDFAKNLAENLEIHGELALRRNVNRIVLDRQGESTAFRQDQLSYLVGVRYLNTHDTTFIVEYYHNGAGYSRSQINDFFEYQDAVFQQFQRTGDPSTIEKAQAATRPYYSQRNFGQDYLYLKILQKEPLNILYFNPWLTLVANLQDLSFSLQPGLTYTPITDLELGFRMAIPLGPSGTEFGEKMDALRAEFWVRYYF